MLCSTASASCCGPLSPLCLLLLLLCTLHLNAVSLFLHAVFIWINVTHLPQSWVNQNCVVLPVPLAGGGPPFAATFQCSLTTSGNGAGFLPALCTQTRDGKPAKGCTADEWANVMGKFQAAAKRVAAGPTWNQETRRGSPLYSFDNDRIHTVVDTLASLKINKNNRALLPPNSPDLHGVVERCIGRLKAAFQQWLYDHPKARTMDEYQQALRHIFLTNPNIASPRVINKQVEAMPSVYAAVLAAKGDHPPKRFK